MAERRDETYEVAIPLCPSDQFMLDTKQFYDDLSSYYHLIFEDWDASMARQGDALAQLIGSELTGNLVTDLRVLDVACGIGTQALPLAARGFPVTARDLSPAAVARLQQEAQVRELVVDAAVSDMRHVASSVTGLFLWSFGMVSRRIRISPQNSPKKEWISGISVLNLPKKRLLKSCDSEARKFDRYGVKVLAKAPAYRASTRRPNCATITWIAKKSH